MRKTRSRSGFTLAEVLTVVGILAILAAFAMIAINGYLRSMAKLEYDGYAKEIFVAAQNRLTLAESQGYLGRNKTDSNVGTPEAATNDDGTPVLNADGTPAKSGVYYFIVDDRTEGDGTRRDALTDSESILNLMLPIGSVDETVLNSGGFIVRYHKDAAMILDVFYWKENGRFSYASSGKAESAIFNDTVQKVIDISKKYKSDEEEEKEKEKDLKKEFRNLGGSVIGYYGGEQANELTKGDPLEAPTIVVENADRLVVRIKNPNWEDSKTDDQKGSMLRLTITGDESKESRYVIINKNDTSLEIDENGYIVITLDDITKPNSHFKDLFCSRTPEGTDSSKFGGNNLTPGENIRIQAEAYDNTHLTNVAKSPEQKTNSLYGSLTGDTAYITSIRHLENLDAAVSGVSEDKSKAKQSTDLDWETFKKNVTTKDADGNDQPVNIYKLNDNVGQDTFVPINKANTKFDYDGGSHSISNLEISNATGNAGLFSSIGSTEGTSSISNLKLVDTHVEGGGNAGILAGSTANTNISNVMACNSDKTDPTDPNYKPNVKSTNGSAGGLVGTMSGGRIEKSGASVTVESASGDAGGLSGTVEKALINACYTGGQTKEGMYDENYPNVKGAGSVGGLVGSANSSTIVSSYSTCSVYSSFAAGSAENKVGVGGLIGKTSGETATTRVSSSYCTGQVTSGTANNEKGTEGAVVGTAENTKFNETYYYGIINSSTDDKGNYKTMDPVGSTSGGVSGTDKIIEMDRDLETFNNFVKITTKPDKPFDAADPYDKPFLGNEYPFNTVNQLGELLSSDEELKNLKLDEIPDTDFVSVHIGDWPSPETRVINTL